jgi:hypothetical protein
MLWCFQARQDGDEYIQAVSIYLKYTGMKTVGRCKDRCKYFDNEYSGIKNLVAVFAQNINTKMYTSKIMSVKTNLSGINKTIGCLSGHKKRSL